MRSDEVVAVGGAREQRVQDRRILRLDARLDGHAAQARPAGHERVVLPGDREVGLEVVVGRRDHGDLPVVALHVLEARAGGREHVRVGGPGRGERGLRGRVEGAVGRAVVAAVDRCDREVVRRGGREVAGQEARAVRHAEQHAVAVDRVAADRAVGIVRGVPGQRDARVGDRDRAHVRRRVRRDGVGARPRARVRDGRERGDVAGGVERAHAQCEDRRAGEAQGGERRGGATCEHLAAAQQLVAHDAAIVLRGAERDGDAGRGDRGHPQGARPRGRIHVAARGDRDLRDVRPARVGLARCAHLPVPAPRREQEAGPERADVQRLHARAEAAVARDAQVVAARLLGLVPAERHRGRAHDGALDGRGLPSAPADARRPSPGVASLQSA